jgi:hypothetical protein
MLPDDAGFCGTHMNMGIYQAGYCELPVAVQMISSRRYRGGNTLQHFLDAVSFNDNGGTLKRFAACSVYQG